MSNIAATPSLVLASLDAKTVKKVGEETLTLATPGANKRFRVFGLLVGSSVEAVVTLLDEANVIAKVLIPAKTSLYFPFPGFGVTSAATGNKLKLQVSAEAAVTATVFGSEDSY